MAGIFKVVASLIFSKFLEDSVRNFTSKVISQSSSVNNLNQKYANSLNNVEVKVKNYIFVVGLMLMAIFLSVIGILSIVLSLIFYVFNLAQVANPFLIFGIVLLAAGWLIIIYSKRTLGNVSPKNLKY